MAARPWQEDIPEGERYKNTGVVEKDTAEAIDDFGLGHWLDNGRLWSRPEYAYRAAQKARIPNGYFVLVRVIHGRLRNIGWGILILNTTEEATFTSTQLTGG